MTGGASGIGLAIAKRLAAANARIILLDLNAQAVQQAAAALPGSALGIACDVSDPTDVAKAFTAIDAAGPLHMLVNSAGVAHIGTVLSTAPDDFDRLYRVNVRGTYLVMQAAAKRMSEARTGVILNLASIAATAGLPDRFAYSMTKGAVLAMTLAAARDLLPFGVRCNCVSPARVYTPFVEGFLAKNYPGREEEQKKVLAAAQPIGRMGTPEEIAELALFLLSDASGFITGVDYPIDGGFLNLR